MSDVKGAATPGAAALRATLVFNLGTLGALATDRFAARVEALGLKPKHAGLLAALDAESAASQQELATRLGVVPSLIVSLADQLQALGAVERVRDPEDRRRQVLTLTAEGRRLLARCAEAAEAADAELAAGLTAAQRTALGRELRALRAAQTPDGR
ncbi:MarR family winged helix-turn-helix transcriptional regulator [Kitasatospora sp. NPDC088391]|uniref:MarR family winged helix-turn-helix transcriptional regulator n=1 Tax=Kitasatospora sp. NPDC088391 TaxID=3364074 RepID=UPI0037FE9A48